MSPLQNKGQKPVKVLHPKEAMDFVELWSIPGSDHLIHGNADFPNIYSRQDRLVGQVIDACIILHVYEEIKQDASPNSLKPLFSGGDFRENDLNNLKKLPDNKKAKGGSELLNKLIEMSQETHGLRLKSHSDLLSKKKWDAYIKEFTKYRDEYEELEADKAASEALAHSGSYMPNIIKNKAAATSYDLKMPEDPRVTIINKEIKRTIRILNPGPKSKDSMDSKAENKGNVEITSFRDLNRIGVLPVKTEYANDFITIMANLNPAKTVDHNQIPRFFEEQAEVFSHGYYNQKLFVALDRCKDRKGGVTKGSVASIAEIKIIPAKVLDAENLTSITKSVRKALTRPENYIAYNTNDREPVKKRLRLEKIYNSSKIAFDSLVKSLGLPYQFPELNLTKENENNPKTYESLREKFDALSTRIHIDAIKKENDTWKAQYIRTALMQQLAGSDETYLHKINRKLPTHLPRTNTLDNSLLEEIASSVNPRWELENIKEDIKKDFALGIKSSRQQSQPSQQR